MLGAGGGRIGLTGRILPSLSILAITVVTLAPWRVPEFSTFGLPFLTLGAVFYWSERDRRLLPSPVVLAAGLLTDLVTDGPVGYWALLFLTALALGGLTGRLLGRDRSMSGSWLGFAIALPVIVALGWGVASLYYLTILDLRSTLFATAAGITGYLPLAVLLRSMGPEPEPERGIVTRRGQDGWN